MGGDPDAFWRQTPRFIGLFIDAKVRAAKTEQQARAWTVWHNAALPRLKQFPAFDRFVNGQPKPTGRQQSAEDQKQMLIAMTLAMGGTVTKGEAA